MYLTGGGAVTVIFHDTFYSYVILLLSLALNKRTRLFSKTKLEELWLPAGKPECQKAVMLKEPKTFEPPSFPASQPQAY